MLVPFKHRFMKGVSLTDANGHSVSLQESSLASANAVWFGLDTAKALSVSHRALLTQRDVRELLPLLTHFAEHGKLPDMEG